MEGQAMTCDEDVLEPEDADYVVQDISQGVIVGIIGGEILGMFFCHDEAQQAIRAAMTRQHYYPTVWFCSDHGNFSLYTMD
jgi:hypothetical protein